MSEQTPMQQIRNAVTAWPGTEARQGERGELSFRFDGREIGHLHGDRVAHFTFPREVGAELRESGRVGPHPVAPQSVKWASRRIDTDADVEDVIALMRLNYHRLADPGRAGGKGWASIRRPDEGAPLNHQRRDDRRQP